MSEESEEGRGGRKALPLFRRRSIFLLLSPLQSSPLCSGSRSDFRISDEQLDVFYRLTRIKSLPRPWYLANLTLFAMAARAATQLRRLPIEREKEEEEVPAAANCCCCCLLARCDAEGQRPGRIMRPTTRTA